MKENKIITREIFREIMEEVKQVNDYQTELNGFFKKKDVDGYLIQPDCVSSTLKLLHLFFDKDADEWISYFCFELDFGRRYKEGMVTDENGKSIQLKTIDDLYDLLIE